MFTYYQILEINENANADEIKKAYKKMAKKYHPDVSVQENAEEYFKLIITAYQNLSDENQRVLYDTWLQKERNVEEKTIRKEQKKKRRKPLPKDYQPAYSTNSHKKEDEEVIKWGGVAVMGFFVVVLLFIFTNNYLKEKEYEERIAHEFSLLQGAIVAADDGDFVKAFIVLDSIKFDMQYFSSVHRNLYDSLHQELTITSLEYFQNKNYNKIHHLLTDLRDSTNDVLTEEMLWHLALSQFNIREYDHSAVTFRTLLKKNKWDYNAYMAYSEIYSSGLNQPEKAIDILTEGAMMTVEEYTTNYGAAYAVILNGDDIPQSHFNIYFLRARLLMQLERYNEVIRDLNWALRLQPRNKNAHFILGNTYAKVGKEQKACEAWSEAVRLGHLSASTMLDKHCM